MSAQHKRPGRAAKTSRKLRLKEKSQPKTSPEAKLLTAIFGKTNWLPEETS